MKARLYIACLLIVQFAPAAAQQVKVNIGWEYTDYDGTMTIHEIKGRPRLWEMKSVKSLVDAPVGAQISQSSFNIQPGEVKRFALVMRNETDQVKYFFAAPHVAHPAKHSLGFNFKCLCINHAYSVWPRETWYRIVEFRLHDGFVGEELTLTHAVIGIDEARAKTFANKEPPRDF